MSVKKVPNGVLQESLWDYRQSHTFAQLIWLHKRGFYMHILFQPWNRERGPCSQSYSAEYGKKYTNSRFFYTKCNYYNKLILWIDSTDAYFN